jgi:hypothetical protein
VDLSGGGTGLQIGEDHLRAGHGRLKQFRGRGGDRTVGGWQCQQQAGAGIEDQDGFVAGFAFDGFKPTEQPGAGRRIVGAGDEVGHIAGHGRSAQQEAGIAPPLVAPVFDLRRFKAGDGLQLRICRETAGGFFTAQVDEAGRDDQPADGKEGQNQPPREDALLVNEGRGRIHGKQRAQPRGERAGEEQARMEGGESERREQGHRHGVAAVEERCVERVAERDPRADHEPQGGGDRVDPAGGSPAVQTVFASQERPRGQDEADRREWRHLTDAQISKLDFSGEAPRVPRQGEFPHEPRQLQEAGQGGEARTDGGRRPTEARAGPTGPSEGGESQHHKQRGGDRRHRDIRGVHGGQTAVAQHPGDERENAQRRSDHGRAAGQPTGGGKGLHGSGCGVSAGATGDGRTERAGEPASVLAEDGAGLDRDAAGGAFHGRAGESIGASETVRQGPRFFYVFVAAGAEKLGERKPRCGLVAAKGTAVIRQRWCRGSQENGHGAPGGDDREILSAGAERPWRRARRRRSRWAARKYLGRCGRRWL